LRMSPFMAIIALAVLIGVVVFVVGVVRRKRKIILVGAPAALLLVIWFFLASSRPNPQKEFDRIFGPGNRGFASNIQTIKPRFMDGHFICFRMRPADFDSQVRTQFSQVELTSPPNILLGEPLPAGWPPALESTKSVLHREFENQDVYLVYFPSQEMAYASVRYGQW
jgi:hypothetical protein